MSETNPPDPPSPFVVHWVSRLARDLAAPRRALDVAMGRGRHALVLAHAGFRVFGVDLRFDVVRDAIDRARTHQVAVRAWCADMTAYRLPRQAFELLVVTRYLQRDLFDNLRDALSPGGVILYETFTERQRELGRGPTSPEHLLRPGELVTCFNNVEIVFYEEVTEPDALARLVARRMT